MKEVKEQSLYLNEFLEQINNINNLFDLMALCMNYVLMEIDQQEVDIMNVLNSYDSKCEKIINSLSIYKMEKEIDIEYKCLERLKKQLINSLSIEEKIINQCVYIIMWVDDNCEPTYENDEICTYEALNNQFDNKIRIIPRMNNRIDDFSCKFSDEKGQEAFRKDYPVRKSFYTGIVCKYIILDETFLENYKVQIHHLGYKNAFVQKTKNKQTLSFAVFPVLNDKFSEYFKVNKLKAKKKNYFEIDGMYEGKEKVLKQRYDEIFNNCNSENIDFLIFPEMLMTESILDDLQGHKQENWIVFWGSIWKNMTNRCIVTGKGGQAILSYDKKIGFELKEEDEKGKRIYLEHLKEKIKKTPYDLLDIEGIGRVGICICRDLTFQEVSNLHTYLETNILIVPTFSESMDIYTGAEELVKKEKCMVILANSCSAYYDKKHKKNTITELGFFVAPAKKKNARSVYKEVYGNIQCMNECAKACKGILFMVNFAKKMEEDDLLTIDIKKAVIS